MSASRCRFLLESVSDLQARLRASGSDLVILRGRPEDVIPSLAAKLGAGTSNTSVTLYAHTDVCSEEIDVHEAVKSALGALSGSGCGEHDGGARDRSTAGVTTTTLGGCDGGGGIVVREVWGNTLHRVEDLPFNFPEGVPEVFTQVCVCFAKV